MGGLYVSYRYFQIKKFEADFKEIIKDKQTDMTRQRFYELHEKLANRYEQMADNNEVKYGLANTRKSILKFARGVH